MVDVLVALAEYRKKYPDLRLGQMIWNAMALNRRWKAPEANQLFYIEDQQLVTALKNMECKLGKSRKKYNSSKADLKLMDKIVLDQLTLFLKLIDNCKTKPQS